MILISQDYCKDSCGDVGGTPSTIYALSKLFSVCPTYPVVFFLSNNNLTIYKAQFGVCMCVV